MGTAKHLRAARIEPSKIGSAGMICGAAAIVPTFGRNLAEGVHAGYSLKAQPWP